MAEDAPEVINVPLLRQFKSIEIKPPEHILTPRGDIVLGSVDPGTLTGEEFLRSPDVLYHGSATELVFDPKRNIFQIGDNDSGTTIGYGFYTTDRKEEAEHFSIARMPGKTGAPIITPFLPYQARMYDFRSIEDSRQNGLVPIAMVREFSDYFREFTSKRYPRDKQLEGMDSMFSSMFWGFVSNLENIVALNTPFDLRGLFDPEARGSSPRPVLTHAYTRFMLGKGYDGIIYVEGGDIPEQKDPTSFTFYNLSKVGTYESWNQKD